MLRGNELVVGSAVPREGLNTCRVPKLPVLAIDLR